ncbi:GNAT family N-acetyltransferase [Cryomorphaceae bacterium 1068]|nr:GNAT family N-acetyltransferase [Cryomorphaceae bacterium 1068]
MKIENSTLEDIPRIFEFYRIATAYMKSKNQVHWPEFSIDLIMHEINEHRQWKLVMDQEIACIWATTLEDELIWGHNSKDPALYIHRIAVNPDFRGKNLVNELARWANDFGHSLDLKYIRIDTVGYNQALISHYEKVGFEFLGMRKLANNAGLLDHYKEGEVCYFQKEIRNQSNAMRES